MSNLILKIKSDKKLYRSSGEIAVTENVTVQLVNIGLSNPANLILQVFSHGIEVANCLTFAENDSLIIGTMNLDTDELVEIMEKYISRTSKKFDITLKDTVLNKVMISDSIYIISDPSLIATSNATALFRRYMESANTSVINFSIPVFNGTGGMDMISTPATIDETGSINIPLGQTYKINGISLTYSDVGAAPYSVIDEIATIRQEIGNIVQGAGTGTLTAVSIATANGISGTSSGGATPTLTITLGAITPTSVNSVVLSGSGTPTLAVTGTASISGANTGDQTSVTGNAGTATKLATPRAINGVNFDGSAPITINAVDSTARVASTEKGANSGVATLDSSGKIPTAQLPAAIFPIEEYANLAGFPNSDQSTSTIYVALDTAIQYRWSGTAYTTAAAGVQPNGAITGATKTKITYDAKGLVTSGADATTADIADSTDKRYCTDAEKALIGTGGGGGITWSAVTADATMVVDNGYIANKGTLLTMALPATSLVGKVLRIAGMNAGLWKISQAALQYIKFGEALTSVGTDGYVASTKTCDAVELVCIEADKGWAVVSSVGNIDVI